MRRTLVVHANDPLALVACETKFGPTYHPAVNAVYIGRASRRANNPIAHVDSPYRNPWTISEGTSGGLTEDEAREYALDVHDRWLDGEIDQKAELRDYVLAHLHELRGAVLVCWCANPGQPLTHTDPRRCHGQNLARRIDGA